MLRTAFVIVCCLSALRAQTPDRQTFERIRKEATDHSQVETVFDMLTVNIGPRLTASPAHKRAAEWTRQTLASYGLDNAHLEAWKFGRGWTMESLTVEMIEPRYLPLIGYADGWSPSTNGGIVAAPVFVGGKTPEAVAAMSGQLRGAIVMQAPILTNFIRKDRPQPTDPNYEPNSAAYATSLGGNGRGRGRGPTPAQQIAQTIREAGAGVLLKPSQGEHGTVFVTGRDGGASAIPTITLSAEHYNMIARMIQHNVAVKVRVNLKTKYYDDENGNAYNVIAELPGSDLKDEVVMIGGHLDSWHTGVGATDNADGVATVMEAMRILKSINAKPRRTIRVALWGGEEQGMLGSKAWVEQHLKGDSNTLARSKFDVYFNIDNGTGPIYGWYLQNSKEAQPLFDAWMEPLKTFGGKKNTIEPIGSTDHLSFTDIGMAGFNPIQDYSNYDIRTHHTNMDTAERLSMNDIRQAATAMAWFAYCSAMNDQKIARPAPRN